MTIKLIRIALAGAVAALATRAFADDETRVHAGRP